MGWRRDDQKRVDIMTEKEEEHMKQYKSRIEIENIVDQIESEIANDYGVGFDLYGECRPEEVEKLMTHAQFARDSYVYEETIEEIREFYQEIAQGILDDDAEKDAQIYQFREKRISGRALRYLIRSAINQCRVPRKVSYPVAFGVRFCPYMAQGGEGLEASYQWDIENDVSCYETTGEQLAGTSAIDITYYIIERYYEVSEAARQIFEIVTTANYDGYPCIIRGVFAGYGQDDNEVLIEDAEVVMRLVFEKEWRRGRYAAGQ